VLWEGYNEPYSEGKKLIFGYTPNYLRIGCVIGDEESLENRILNARLVAVDDNCIFGERVAKS
jgi:threonylcarbamoyladenosine tRNA methylthiotransferase MtaB